MIQRPELSLLLEYAYRGVAAQGGKRSCHTDRTVGCSICDVLTAAEAELRSDPNGEYDIDPQREIRDDYEEEEAYERDGYRVTERIDGAHPRHDRYPLLPDDLLVKHPDGTWAKEAPGLAVLGFVLTPEQAATLTPVKFVRNGLEYGIIEGT